MDSSSGFTTGVSRSTALGDIVPIPVPLMGPYGMLLESGEWNAVVVCLSSSLCLPAFRPVMTDELGKSAVIKAWERLPDGKIGPVQKVSQAADHECLCARAVATTQTGNALVFPHQHGGVRIGDVLIAVNDTQLHDCPFSDVSPTPRGP